ncbi:MAG TPA: amino acid adenylation domain-containing protein [Clostridiaceae bacterium]|nr:amino acid adenylation domain-containing protein [Clostridiaceae bacterium]
MYNTLEFYPLSHPQMGIWYIEKYYPGTSIGNIAGTVILKGEIDYCSLERAINIAFEKNDSMRFRIVEKDVTPFQYISEYKYIKLDYVDFSREEASALEKWSDDKTRENFQLLDSSLYYFALVKLSQQEGGFYIKAHHLVSDAWTMTSVINQILEYYWRLVNNTPIPEDVKPSYVDYIQKEVEYKNSNKFQKDEEFWNSIFNGIPEEKASLTYSTRNNRCTGSIRKTNIISPEQLLKINAFCDEYKISPFIFFLSTLFCYIARVTSKNDIIIGTPVLNRSNSREKDTLGIFVNTVPFRLKIDKNLDFVNFVQQVSREWRSILRHSNYPYDLLLKSLREKYKFVDNLYDIVISYQNAKFNKSTYITDYVTHWNFNGNQTDPLYIHISDRESSGSMILDYDYLENLFTEKDIHQIHNGLMVLINDIISDPSKKLYQLEIMEENEKKKILNDFNDTTFHYSEDRTVHQLFEEQVSRTPDNIALVFEDKSLTYRELNERANRLARVLRAKGATRDSIVSLIANRSLDMIVGIIGILKAGAAYLPIDPDYPDERIKFIIEDSGSKILLTQKDLVRKYNFRGEIVTFQDDDIADKPGSNLESISSLDSLAYVIYTSGSTGQPKGVMLNNRGIVSLMAGTSDIVGFSHRTSVISITTVSFDIFIFEAIIPLLKGCKVIIANREQQRIPEKLNKAIIENEADVLQTTPSIMNMFLSTGDITDGLRRLKTIILGGEAFPIALLEKLRSITKARIFNGYGPTETTIYSTIKDLTDAGYISIGAPVSNTKIYILDEYLNPLPLNRTGEIYIGGAGVGRGYINREQMTGEKFIPSPFVKGEYIYKTGDLGRWLTNGEIEFVGRADNQVKIRGLRIELGEIENLLLQHEQVEKAVVIDREDQYFRKYLCAYIVPKDGKEIRNIRNFLSQQLPVYMIPSYFMYINEIPLTPNGKIDREKLPTPVLSENKVSGFELPADEIEIKLSEIWCRALNIDKISVNDSFFELGGDSLSIIYVVSAISKEFNVNISIEDIYKLETIKEQAGHIRNLGKKEIAEVPHAGIREYYPLSSAQKRMYILTQLDEDGTSYNMPGALNIEGKLDVTLLENCFKHLINRHEALRTCFKLVDGVPVQKILERVDFSIEYIDGETNDIKDIINNFVQPFDLTKAPIMRASLVKIGKDRHVLLFDIHHIISDGLSINILMKELGDLYSGKSLSELKVHYKDYAVWQNELVNSETLKKQEKYWLEQLSGELPVLNLPTDFSPHLSKTNGVGSWRFTVGKSVAEKIKKLASGTGTTLFMILLSVYNILLSKYSGQEDIIVGTPVAGRKKIEFQNIIGTFVNTLALRNFPRKDLTYKEFLSKVKDCTLKALENQDYQFDDLVNSLKLKRDVERNPIFNTMFSLRAKDSPNIKMDDLNITTFELGYKTARFPLVLEAWETDEGIAFLFDYCAGTYTSNTIRLMGEHYISILEDVLEDPEKVIKDIELLSEEDKKRIIQSYNMTAVEYPLDKTIDELFEEQVEKAPDNTALLFENLQVSYSDLNKKANQIAWYLRKKGIAPGSIVGIMLNRSVELIAGILGVIKAGGAYMPIDYRYPYERIKYMIENSKAVIILTQSERLKDVPVTGCDIVLVDSEDINKCSEENPPKVSQSHHPLYVIYTSGSTGNPKGVILSHKPLNNFIHVASADISLSNKTMLCKTTMCFDIFAFETLLPLSKGMKIVLANDTQYNNPRLLNELIIKHNANITITTPSTLKLMADDQLSSISFMKLTDIIIGGEVLDVKFLARLKELTSAKIYNAYGPTETTIYSTIKDLTNTDNITIGKPIGNTKIFILDQDLKLLPERVVGEICIGGHGLAEGYLNDFGLTRSKFIPSPFDAGERIYRTGDLGKWLGNGEIEYIGRMDHQIKIRGIRVEIDEIVNVLLTHKQIKEALVVDKEEGGRKYLCAYLVPKKNTKISIASLKLFLSKKLPDYMIPTYFVILEAFPLNSNGKIDRNQLPEPERLFDTEEEYKPAEDDIEKILVNVWSEVLNIEKDKLSVNHNFFELGGDSLAVIQVQTKILHYNWGLTIDDFYKYQTISKLAGRIKGSWSIDDIEYNSWNEHSIGADINISSIQKDSSVRMIKNRNINDSGILLTGATGFLGIHILNELVSSTNARVYCLVRSESKKEGKERLKKLLNYYFPGRYPKINDSRIYVISGDITLDNLGMNDNDLRIVSEDVSHVIHTAAIVKHYGNYSDFKEINVQGTQKVIDFCTTYGKTMSHVSTCSVAGSHTENYLGKEISFTEKDFYIGQSFNNNVYITSKFEAEGLVFRAMKEGLEAAIFRLGNLTGRYSDGWFQINMYENAFYNMIASIAKIKRISEDLLQESVDLTPVDYCSRAIIKLIDSGQPCGRVFHLCNNNTIVFKDIVESLKNNGICIEVISRQDFDNYISTISRDKEKQGALTGLVSGMYFQNRSLGKTSIRINSDITQKYLTRIGFQWPPVDGLYLNKITKFIKHNWNI